MGDRGKRRIRTLGTRGHQYIPAGASTLTSICGLLLDVLTSSAPPEMSAYPERSYASTAPCGGFVG